MRVLGIRARAQDIRPVEVVVDVIANLLSHTFGRSFRPRGREAQWYWTSSNRTPLVDFGCTQPTLCSPGIS